MTATPKEVRELEERYAVACDKLAETLDHMVGMIPNIKQATGLSDASVVFDQIYKFIRMRHAQQPSSVITTEVFCAAALTKLAQASRGEDYDMAQFETSINEGKLDQ